MMKKIIIVLFGLLISCKSNDNKSIDIFNTADYVLSFNDRIVKNIPDNEVHQQVISTYFANEQLPLFRTIESGVNTIYIAIPTGVIFSDKKITEAPANCEVIEVEETFDTKYISYKCDKKYTAIYLRNIKNNTFCIIVSGKEEKSFEKDGKKENIDKKIILKE